MHVPVLSPANLAFMPANAYDHILNPGNIMFMVPIICTVAFFTFLSIAVWAKFRMREREAFYKNEAIQKIAASPDGASAIMEYMREEKALAEKKRREKLRLGGAVITAAGFGLTICLFAFERADHDPDPNYSVGLILLLIGVAMLIYSYWLAPKE